MLVIWFIAIVLVILYFFWIGLFYFGWSATPSRKAVRKRYHTSVSVIVPVRNEEANIMILLNALTTQSYPQNLIEIILIDDHSSDLTPDIASYFARRHGNIRYLKLENNIEGKKPALRKGVSESRYPFILTIDADCIPSPGWIRSMVDCYESSGADIVAGPVLIGPGPGFLNMFQRLELFSILGLSAGSVKTGKPVICSSANLGFRREAFIAVRDLHYPDITSDDNVILVLAMQKTGLKNSLFVKNHDAIVTTKAQQGIGDLLAQRKRWAFRRRYYNTGASGFTSLLIFLIHFYALLCFFGGVVYHQLFLAAAFIFIAKSVVDFPFLFSVTGYFGERRLMKYFPVAQLLFYFYISFTAITAFTDVFDWKGRLVKY